MAISFVGAAISGGTAIPPTPPAHVAGDLFLTYAGTDGLSGPVTVPSGWTVFADPFAPTSTVIFCYKIAASSSEPMGSWPNMTGQYLFVYRGTRQHSPIGSVPGLVSNNTANQSSVTAAALPMNAAGTSWGVTFLASSGGYPPAPPSGMTVRTYQIWYDTNAPLATMPSNTYTGLSPVAATTYYMNFEIYGTGINAVTMML